MNFSQSKINFLIVHEIGNKLRDEKVFLTDHLSEIDPKLEHTLLTYFLNPFIKVNEKFCFTHPSNLSFNEMYSFSRFLFDSHESSNFIEITQNIAKHLYEFSLHPRITKGELILTYVENVIFEGKPVNVIGIFKSENKHDFLKVIKNADSKEISLIQESGIDLLKLEKGCLIIDTDRENGFEVLNIDKQNHVTDYWMNKFLSIKKLKNDSQKTKDLIHLCRSFSESVLLENHDSSTSISFNNQFIGYFEQIESFEYESFEETVLGDPRIKKEFHDFYESNDSFSEINLQDSFSLSKRDIKHEKKRVRSAIKLDTDIELNMSLGSSENMQNIEKGYDSDKGMHFYKVYFHKEIK